LNIFGHYSQILFFILTGAELRRMLVSVCEGPNGPPGREETQDLLKLLDVDGDGMCSREEFINAVR